MARSAVRSRFLSLRHTKITCPNNEDFIVATHVFAGDFPSDHRPGKSPARVRRPITLHCPGGSSMRSRDLPIRCAMGDPRVDDAPGRARRRGARVDRGVSGSSTKARLLRCSTARPRDSSAPRLARLPSRESTLSVTGCRGVAGSSCGAPQEAHFGGAPRYTSINARAAPAGPPGRVVDARIAHRAPNGQISTKNEKYLALRQKHVRRGSLHVRLRTACSGQVDFSLG